MSMILLPNLKRIFPTVVVALFGILGGLIIAGVYNIDRTESAAAPDIILYVEDKTTMSEPEEEKQQALPVVPELTYELVLSEERPNKLRRYAAKEKKKQSDEPSFQNITVHRWISLLLEHEELIAQFNDILRQANIKAYFFETKGVNWQSSQTTTLEFVLVESTYLYQFADAKQDPTDFGDKLHCGDDDGNAVGCVFPNLGGDSILVAPREMIGAGQKTNVYGHLGAFVRRAPLEAQVIPFWKLALEALEKTLQNNPNQTYWFSTDGTGVNWLHIRIDPRPKYYDYQPFARGR